jgi:condensation domain-containing protein
VSAGEFPALPAQAAFRAIDRAGRGLTTVVSELPLMPGTDLGVLGRAVRVVGVRHEALRTAVERVRDMDSSAPDFLWLGFRNVVARDCHVTLEQVTGQGRPPRADPSRLPVFRFQAVMHGTEMALRIVTDHALCDGWSLRVLYRDIELAYARALTPGEPPMGEAYPFSRFAGQRHRQWRAGELEGAVRTAAERICAVRPPDASEPAGLPRWPFIKAYEIRLGKESAARFEAIRSRAKCTRFAVALALYFMALNAVFGWHDFVARITTGNRPRDARDSVGLFSDSQFLTGTLGGGFYALAHSLAASMVASMSGSFPPAVLVQEQPAVREALAAFPHVTADVLPGMLPAAPPGRETARLYLTETPGGEPCEDDVIEPVPVPRFAAQPDFRLSCSFSRHYHLRIAFRVDRIPERAAVAVAQGILDAVRQLP